MQNINELTLEQLAVLRAQVDNLLKIRQAERIVHARREILSIANGLGISVEAILDDRAIPDIPGGVRRRVQHPERPELEWAGRGRRPNWMKELLAAGRSIDDLRGDRRQRGG